MTRQPLEELVHEEIHDWGRALSDEAFLAELRDPEARAERVHGSPHG